MQDEVLAALDESAPELLSIALAIATPATISALAPKRVTVSGTLDFRALVPEPGGLFDHRVFGPGTVIDAALPAAEEAFKKPRTAFARYELARAMPHPLVATARLEVIAVLPPDLRALVRLADDRWKVAGLNEVYQQLIMRDTRGSRASARAIEATDADPDFDRDMGELSKRLLAELFALAGGRAAIVETLVACDARRSLEPVTHREYRALAALTGAGVHVALADS